MEIKDIWERPIWTLKQLIPLRYETEYTDKDGKWLCIWRMWLGSCYSTKRWRLCPQ